MSLELKGVSYTYGAIGGRRALADLSLVFGEGELVCVLGPNGAGKSTLFRCVLSLLRGYKGSIRLDGIELRSMSGSDLSKKIAYIPQAHEAVFDYSSLEVVLMGVTGSRGLFSTPRPQDEAAALAQLQVLGIGHLAHRSYAHISGGERQLVLIARALAQNAKVLVMDEPTANLDYGNQVRVMEHVSGLAKKGYAVILSTHNPEHAFLWASRLVIIADGRIVAEGIPSEILSEDLMEMIYGVRVKILPLQGNEDSRFRSCVPAETFSRRVP